MPYFKHQISVEFIDVQMQDGSHDCGLFALAYITSICNGQDPAVLLYKQRKHILKSIEGVMTAFPNSANRLPKASIRKNIPVYCIYQHINDGSKMIQCDICQRAVVPCSLHEDRQKFAQRSQVNVELPFMQYTHVINLCYPSIKSCTCILSYTIPCSNRGLLEQCELIPSASSGAA